MRDVQVTNISFFEIFSICLHKYSSHVKYSQGRISSDGYMFANTERHYKGPRAAKHCWVNNRIQVNNFACGRGAFLIQHLGQVKWWFFGTDASPRQSCHTKIRYDNYPSIFGILNPRKQNVNFLQKTDGNSPYRS